MNEVDDAPTVCIAHGAFIPCRRDGEHRLTSNPYWVKAVRDYQGSSVEGLTWEPAWEKATPAPTERDAGEVGVAAVRIAEESFRHSWDMSDERKIDGAWVQGLCCECGEFVPFGQEVAHVAEAFAPLIAERERAAGERALREAADALEGGLGVEGTPRNLYEFRVWLRDRAAALAPGPHDFDNHGPTDNLDCPGCALAPETREDT